MAELSTNYRHIAYFFYKKHPTTYKRIEGPNCIFFSHIFVSVDKVPTHTILREALDF